MNSDVQASSRAAQFRSLSILIAVACVDMLGFAMIFPLMPFYALDFGISPRLIGVIVAAYPLMQWIASPLWGRVSDRYGRRPVLLFGLGASATSFLVFSVAGSFWTLLLSRMIQGAGGGTTGVLHAYVTDTVPPEDRTRSLGWLSAATSAGTMIGPVIGSTAAYWGQAAPGLVAASLCLLNMVFAWRWLKESSPADHEARTMVRRPVWHTAWIVVRHPGKTVSRLIWIYGLGMMAFSTFTATLALYLGLDFGIDEHSIGYVFLYTGALSVVMRSLLLGPIVSRLGEASTMRIGAASLLASFIGFLLASDLWVFMAVLALLPIGTSLTFPSTTALTSRWSEKREVGTTMGTAQSFGGLSRTVSPLVATYVFQQASHAAPFLLAVGYTLVLIGFSIGIADPGKREEEGDGPLIAEG